MESDDEDDLGGSPSGQPREGKNPMQGTPGGSAGRLKRHRDDGAGPANGGLEDDDDLREPGPASAVRLLCPLGLRPG